MFFIPCNIPSEHKAKMIQHLWKYNDNYNYCCKFFAGWMFFTEDNRATYDIYIANGAIPVYFED